jgi:NADP-reducing hydrogenase subunit HndC
MSKLSRSELISFRNDIKRGFSNEEADNNTQIIIGVGTCGIAAGARETEKAFIEELKLQNISNTSIISETGCMGLCHVEPTLEVKVPGMSSVIYGNVDEKVAREIVRTHIVDKKYLDDYLFDKPAADIMGDDDNTSAFKQYRIVLRNCGIIDPEKINEYIARDGYKALDRAIFDMTGDDIINELKISGLRGRGGAGFPTWMKWKFTRQVDEESKYIVCNADEGDPGAYMDRSTLEGDPHSILEAMTIAGFCINSHKGYIYIRAEYPLAIERLKTAMKQSRALGLLGNNILGSDYSFDIEIRLGAGAFVCGEETALLESIEGERGMPNSRPPFPALKGVWGKPTIINNVETWASIPVIIDRGGEWFAGIGTEDTRGTKVFALTGKVKNSGLVEVPMGTTLREIIFDIGGGIPNGKVFKAVQTGGPSGGVITKEYLDTPIDYKSLQELGSIMGSGGMIVLDEDDCMVDVSKFYLGFTIDESCGKCPPCRVGGRALYNILEKITKGAGESEDLNKLRDIGASMQKASLCGLGQTSPNPILSTLKYFENEYIEHIIDKKCNAKKCKSLITFEVIPDACTGCTLCARKCPVNVISGVRKEVHFINQDACIKCGECFEVCNFDAILIK